MNCGTCKWYAKDKGECRANFPYAAGWPKVDSTDWCRGYEPRPSPLVKPSDKLCPYCSAPIPEECGGRCASCNAKLD